MRKETRFTKLIAARIPEEVWKAIEKRIEHKQKKFPRYTEGDIIRTSLVNHLKNKGYLDKGKDYL